MTQKLALTTNLLVRGNGRTAVTTAFIKAGSIRLGRVTLGGTWNHDQVMLEVKRNPLKVVGQADLPIDDAYKLLVSLIN